MTDKFCINCKHSKPSGADDVFFCTTESTLNLVTGEKKYKYCSTMRMEFMPCGIEGKLYEEPEPISFDDIFPDFPSIRG